MSRKDLLVAVVAAAMLATSGCGGGGSGSTGGGGSPTTPVPSATVSGAAAKGLLLNAIVNFYSVTNGVEGTAAVATIRTDAKTGTFSTTVASAGPVVVTVTTDATTQMLDEISGTAITAPSGLVLHAIFDSVGKLQPISVTPLTEMAYALAKAASGGLSTMNIDAANNAVSTAFLAGAPALYTQPIDIATYASATAAEQELAKLLVALSVAANEGIATGSSGSPCASTYSANIVCLIGGLPKLVTINSSGTITLGATANYIASAYATINSGNASIGGKTASALGLNVATASETSLLAAIAKQAPLPGYDPGADALANTKALFANIRTNIVDQSATQTFGYAPTLTALQADYNTNVNPIASNTAFLLASAYNAVQLIDFATTSSATFGVPSNNIANPVALAEGPAGSIYAVNSNATIVKVTASAATILAGQPNMFGSTDGAAGQATFTNPNALAFDSSGNAYVSDNDTIRMITAAGVVSTLAGQAGTPGASDGTGAAATFSSPTAIAVDSVGNVYVADSGNGLIRKIAAGGVVTTLPIAQSSLPFVESIAVDGSGNLYVCAGSAIEKITPSGTVVVLAGQLDVFGYVDGAGSLAQFASPSAITIDGAGNLYVFDALNLAIRKVTPAGVVSTVAKTTYQDSSADGSGFGYITGIALDASGNVYVADFSHSSVQEVTADGAIVTIAHSVINYQRGCGYDPVGLNTADNVAVCRYGLGDNQLLLTVTKTAAGSYTLETQPLTTSASPTTGGVYNAIYNNEVFAFAVNAAFPAAQSTFSWMTSSTGAQSAAFSGPYYVNSTGGKVQGTIGAAESSDWNAATGTGSLSVSGTLSGGSGGVSLVNATLGTDSVITLQNTQRLLSNPGAPVVSATSPAVTISGVLDLSQFTTDAFSYVAKATVGAPVYDKSKALALPGTAAITGSITQLSAGMSIPLFSGSIGVSFEGLAGFDATQPISATNFFTTQGQLSGTLSFTGGRVLTVTATANASQLVPTVAQPDSISVSYSYVTPSGTAALNATGKYDNTDGYSGTITNNSGVVISVTGPIGGTLTGTVTANGTETATIKGAFIYYNDNTSESLF